MKLAQAEIPCRVMTYNYGSDWFMTNRCTRLTSMSNNLLYLLSAHRNKQGSSRPLIFIGHSLGGIVIEQVSTDKSAVWVSVHAYVEFQ